MAPQGFRVTGAFEKIPDGTRVREIFDAEPENDPEMQRQGRQAILDRFGRHVEAKARS